MSENDTVEDIKRALNGRPGQPIVFGVCKALAARCGCEPWLTRVVAIVLGLIFTLPTLAAYIVLGLALKETEMRTRGFFSGLAVIIREWSEKLFRNSRDSFHSNGCRRDSCKHLEAPQSACRSGLVAATYGGESMNECNVSASNGHPSSAPSPGRNNTGTRSP